MMKQVGFNHNIRHKGILFHVQTEDYGQQLHKIVTQLFHAGQIICKAETDYRMLLKEQDAETIAKEVKAMMKMQHKKMLQDLSNGGIAIPDNIRKKSEKAQ
ncbi:MAG: hypothetical protein R3A45_05125 [Bdellovibrionota bacterium]